MRDSTNIAPGGPDSLTVSITSEKATARLAASLARALAPGTAIHLSGDLGSGKTAFTRALLRALGYNGRVKSPTFTLMEPYNLSRFDLYHFDFYRLSTERAWLDAGFDEYLDGRGVVVVEWPERAADTLPPPDLHLRIDFDPAAGADARRIEASAHGARGVQCLNAMRDAGSCAPAPGREPARR